MDGLKVSQLAERAGVPATTLRFYEQHRLLAPRRSESGYRLFDDDAVDQLRFIATAKSLGLSLDEIRVLLGPWRRQGCREVQRALIPLLDQRAAEAREQIAALQEFAARLDDARRLLDDIDRDGPCDASCTFLTGNRAAAASPSLAAHRPVPGPRTSTGRDLLPGPSVAPAPGPGDGVPEEAGAACSLPAPSWRDRWARWSQLLTHATGRQLLGDRVRVEFDPVVLDGAGAGELAALVRAEQDCCPTLQMTLIVGAAITVDAHVPDQDALDVAEHLFGPLTTELTTEHGPITGPAAPRDLDTSRA